ncbi:MAG: ABC transporter permease [Chloroflexi bacterium]|nr:ABC transporter permease [Chloroflexota bacterium]
MNTEIKPDFLKPRWSKVFTDLWDDKTRTGLVVASIAAGVFAVGMIISAYMIMREDIDRSYAAVNPPNIEVQTDPFDQDLVSSIKNVPGVKDVEGRFIIGIRARRGAEDWMNMTLVGLDDLNGNINLRTPVEGLGLAEKDEAVISQDVMHISGLHAGDRIEIELPDGSNHILTIAGLVADQTTSKPDPAANNLVFVTLKTLRSLGLDGTFNLLYLTVKDGGDSEFIANVAANVKEKVEASDRTAYRVDQHLSSEHPMTDITLIIIGVLAVLGGLITILSSSLIVNTLNALLAQQLRQIGVMKLIGARSRQILGMYLVLVIAYGVIALVIAIPLGAIGGYGLAWFMAYLLGAVLQGFRFVPVAVLAQTLIALLIPLGAGFVPVNNSAKTSVLEAISNYRPGGETAANTKNRFSRWIGWISRPILLSFRNTFRKRGRLLLTIFTLTVAGAVFIAVFNVRDSLTSVMENLLQHYMGDVTVNFSQPYRVDKIRQTLLQIPGVEGVEGWSATSGEIWDKHDKLVSNLSIVAPPQDSKLLNLRLVAGRWLSPGEKQAIVVSDSLYLIYPDLKPGDQLIIKLPGQRKESWTVVGVFPFLAMFGDPMAYANFEYVAEKNHLANRTISYRIITRLHDPTSNLELTRSVESYLTQRNFALQSVESGSALRQKASIAINVVIIFLLIMAILTAFVGSMGLTGAMSINVLERTREIGVMRTIGAVDKVIMQSVIIEGLVIGLITWVLAIGVSFPIGYTLLGIISKALGTPMDLTFTPLGILLWLGVVIALSVFASIMPARNAAKLTINEVLAYE